MSSKPGPVPKRSEERRRRNTPAAGAPEKLDISKVEGADDPDSLPFLIKQPIVIPEPVTDADTSLDDDGKPTTGWHPIALELWESFKRSGQAIYWEPSDWAIAKLACESISRDLKPQFVGVTAASEMAASEAIYERIPLKGGSLSAYLKLFGQLMLTEGERRRLALELQRPRAAETSREPAKVVKITDRKQALLKASS